MIQANRVRTTVATMAPIAGSAASIAVKRCGGKPAHVGGEVERTNKCTTALL
jgi:hypothetical protein